MMKDFRVPTTPKEAKEWKWTTVKQAQGKIPLPETPKTVIRGHEYYPGDELVVGMTAENWLKNLYIPQPGEFPIFKNCYSFDQVERLRCRFDWEVWQHRRVKACEVPAAVIRSYKRGNNGWLETEVFRFDQTEPKLKKVS